MSEQGRSWFYLTLWRGTPPEQTHYADTVVHTEDTVKVMVKQADSAQASIKRSSQEQVKVEQHINHNTAIISKFEVIVYGDHRRN